MKTIKVSEATNTQLDWLVARCEGLEPFLNTPHDGNAYTHGGRKFLQRYSALWGQGGPIIERIKGFTCKQWLEANAAGKYQFQINNYDGDWVAFGPTLLIAGLRCYVASRLGDTVEIPEELT